MSPKRPKCKQWSSKRPKWRPKAANFWKGTSAKFKGKIAILGKILARSPFWKVQKAKMKEMKAQKAKMKGNESPKGKKEREWNPKRLKCKEMSPKRPKCKQWSSKRPKWRPKAANFWKGKSAKFKGKIAIFGQILAGWPVGTAEKAKMKGNQFPKTKMKEMKPQKAKKKGNQAPKEPKWKENKAQKAKMKGIEGPKGQNERKRS